MKIIWHNPKKITSKGASIVKTGWLETEDDLQFFYRSTHGPGILGTMFELRVNRTHAA
jgi:hypothetical protein